ncbi:hypothetical protein KKH23_04985 [Patescibacteria group bacterium]|nr:hypothetical protein [Patescibacteria group bacterium]MBU1067237.1 hypothetical protein [Patescibacteria group bacterium]
MPISKFENTMYVTAYELARDGLPDKQIAQALGVAQNTLVAWCRYRPALADALARGRRHRDPGNELTFHQYIYDHLSPNLKDLWDEINECEELENGMERMEALFKYHGKRARQHLFVYSLTQSMFNISQSLRKLGIPRKTYEGWCANDPEFHELMDEIHWHKKNFFEQAFIGRVACGDTAAVIHAVKTKCRDRGYSEKIEIEHTGTLQHEHTIRIVDLDLDLETRKKVLDALRAKQQALDALRAKQQGALVDLCQGP